MTLSKSDQPSPALDVWESRLSPQVRTVELLGEIPITADECAQLGKAIGRHVKRWGHTKALRSLQDDLPCAFAVYLVAQGVHGYKGGDYWGKVVQKSMERHVLCRTGEITSCNTFASPSTG